MLSFLRRRRVSGVFRMLVFLWRPVFRVFTGVFTLVASIIIVI